MLIIVKFLFFSTLIFPIPSFPLFILAFYYGKTFKDKAKWFIIIDVLTVSIVSVLAGLNQIYHFSGYDWTWYDRWYLLGFMLALPLLKLYNGQKGKAPGRYFFYGFYPVHLMVLTIIKYVIGPEFSLYHMYLGIHVACLVVIIAMIVATLRTNASRMQTATVLFLTLEAVYTLGFIVEILSFTENSFYIACIVEYFGELLMMVAALMFTSECGRTRIPSFVYLAHALCALLLVSSIVTSPNTGFFYSAIDMIELDGYAKAVYHHSIGFYLSILYLTVVFVEMMFMGVNSLNKGSVLERKRMSLIMAALMFLWVPYAVTLTGITGGYEYPAIGILAAAILLQRCFFKYGSLDSAAIAGENALGRAGEGVIVIDDRFVVDFTNSLACRIVGDDALINTDARKNDTIMAILGGSLADIRIDDKIFEVRLEEIKTSGYIQGYTIWFHDDTEHRRLLNKFQDMAIHDTLTGLYNRGRFERLVTSDIDQKRPGTFIMMDMDNFKAVNDHYGHSRGDDVLTTFAGILASYPEDILYSCRMGGDEFILYLRDITERSRVEEIVDHIFDEFKGSFDSADEIKCSLSAGIIINADTDKLLDFGSMYALSDEKLYQAKDMGKDRYTF